MLWRCTWRGFAISVIIALVIPSRYTSTVRLMPPENHSNTAMALLSAAVGQASIPFAGDLLQARTTGDLFIAILHSSTLQDDIINQFDLRKVYGEKRWVDARKKLSSNTDTSEDRKSGVITIEVTDRNPERAAEMGHAYVQELNHVVSTLSTSSAHKERMFLEERLKHVKQALDASSQALAKFSSKNATVDIQNQGKAMTEAAATLQGELIAAKSQLKGLEQIYTDDNVRVRSLRARINELTQQLRDVTGTNAADANTYDPDKSPFPSIRQLPMLGATYADLYRQTKIQETVFEVLTRQYELAKVEEAKETPTVQVLDPAEVPERKSFPPRLLIIATGTLLFLFAGVLTVLVRDGWSRTPIEDPRRQLMQDIMTTTSNSLTPARLWLSRTPVFSRFTKFRMRRSDSSGRDD